jgi:hypothetical protein
LAGGFDIPRSAVYIPAQVELQGDGCVPKLTRRSHLGDAGNMTQLAL